MAETIKPRVPLSARTYRTPREVLEAIAAHHTAEEKESSRQLVDQVRAYLDDTLRQELARAMKGGQKEEVGGWEEVMARPAALTGIAACGFKPHEIVHVARFWQ